MLQAERLAGWGGYKGEGDALRLLDALDDPGLEVDEDRARDVVHIVRLVKEHVLAVAAVHCKVLEDAIRSDAVLGAQRLPELMTN